MFDIGTVLSSHPRPRDPGRPYDKLIVRTPQPPSPLAQESSPTVNEDNYSDDSDHEDEKNEKSITEEGPSDVKDEKSEAETSLTNEAEDQSESNNEKESEGVSESANNAEPEIQKQETEPEVEEPEPEVKEIEVSMSSLVVEENGKFSVSQSPRESVSSAASSQIDRSKKNDVNPDYRSPYALSDDQKKRLRKRERAKQRKLREDAEAEKIQKQEIEVIHITRL